MTGQNAQTTFYSISDLAQSFGVTLRTIRFYEEQGLIEPLRVGQQRRYSKRDQTRLKLILRGKRLGLALAEIKEIIQLYDRSQDETQQSQRLLDALAQRKAKLLEQKHDLDVILSEIEQLEKYCQSVLDHQ